MPFCRAPVAYAAFPWRVEACACRKPLRTVGVKAMDSTRQKDALRRLFGVAMLAGLAFMSWQAYEASTAAPRFARVPIAVSREWWDDLVCGQGDRRMRDDHFERDFA